MTKLYHVPGARSTRSLWLLNELGIEFELVEMPFDLKYLRAPEYLAIHPLGRVSCLVDDNRVIFESGAICQYLCERYDDGTLGRGPDHPERYEWLQWIHYAETIAVHGAALVQQSVFIPEKDCSPLVQKLESKRLEKAIEVLETPLKDRHYLLAKGAWWRVFNEPNLHKFTEPTVHRVDFPNVCLSQAWYDSERRCLIVSTDAGVSGAKGQPTSFRVSQFDPHHCMLTVDGQPSDSWRSVDGELEIVTTVGPHTFLITQ